MSLKLYKRKSGVWYIRGTVQGRRYDESARTRDAAQAEEIRAKIEWEAHRAFVHGESAVITFAEAATDYMLAGGERLHLPPLLRKIGPRRLQDVTQRLVDDLAAERPDAAPASLIRQIYTPIAAVINHADPGRRVTFRKPKIRTSKTDYLTPADAQRWLDILPPHLSRLMVFYLATGCRASEALALDWSDVSPEAERVVFWRTKGDYARGVDLITKARMALPVRSSGPVFRNQAGEPWHGYDAINLGLRKHGERAGMAHVHCHLFRHTWATWAYAMTRDLTFVMQQGGWRSLALLGRYTHAASADLAGAAKDHGWEIPGRSIGFTASSG